MSLFAPILKSTQDVFSNNQSSYRIYFNLSNLNSNQEIKHIQLKVTGYINNDNLIEANQNAPNGIYYYTFTPGNNYIDLDPKILINKQWENGNLYKIQLRFGEDPLWTNGISQFSQWYDKAKAGFSEWSNVMLIKPISAPSLSIINNNHDAVAEQAETATTPIFQGICHFNPEDKEIVEKYKFTIYAGKSSDNEIIETSGWLLHLNGNEQDEYRFQTVLEDGAFYTVKYDTISRNGFNTEQETKVFDNIYTFVVRELILPGDITIDLKIQSISNECNEDAFIGIYLTSLEPIYGTYVLTRSSEKTNFKIWEDLEYFSYPGTAFKNTLIYKDYTVENNIKYKYAFQRESKTGLRTTPIYEKRNPSHSINFEYAYLYANGKQLKLKLNNQVSNFKHSVLENKSDTLGSKYPTILRNGSAYYATFSISGLITCEIDENHTFLESEIKNPSIPITYKRDKETNKIVAVEENECNNYSKYDLVHQNIADEKIFRDKVEEFLNNGKYKLYKSATEGNIIVSLMGVSLTSNQSLGRMIYEFSAMAYEMADFNLDNLKKYNILNLSSPLDFYNQDTKMVFGQLHGYYFGENEENIAPDNLIQRIRRQVEFRVNENVKQVFKELVAIEIEPYPDIDFDDEINQLMVAKDQALRQGDLIEYKRILTILNREEKINQDIQNAPKYTLTRVIINTNKVGRQPIVIAPNRKYYLQETFGDLILEDFHLAYSSPVIINYICKVSSVPDDSFINITTKSTITWGQIAGEFKEELPGIKINLQGRDFQAGGTYVSVVINGIKVATTKERQTFQGTKTMEYLASQFDSGNPEFNKEYDIKYLGGTFISIVPKTEEAQKILQGYPPYLLVGLGGHHPHQPQDLNTYPYIQSEQYFYATQDIIEVIKERSKEEVEKKYNTVFSLYDPITETWSDGKIFHIFKTVESIEIEVDKQTQLNLVSTDDQIIERIIVGPTEKYVLHPSANLITSLYFNKPSYAIINYKCSTVQLIENQIGG